MPRYRVEINSHFTDIYYVEAENEDRAYDIAHNERLEPDETEYLDDDSATEDLREVTDEEWREHLYASGQAPSPDEQERILAREREPNPEAEYAEVMGYNTEAEADAIEESYREEAARRVYGPPDEDDLPF